MTCNLGMEIAQAWKLPWYGNYIGVEITLTWKLPWRGNCLGVEITLSRKLPWRGNYLGVEIIMAWKLLWRGNYRSMEIMPAWKWHERGKNLKCYLGAEWCGKDICMKLTMAWNSFRIINKELRKDYQLVNKWFINMTILLFGRLNCM